MSESLSFKVNPKAVSRKIFDYCISIEVTIALMDIFLSYYPHKLNWHWMKYLGDSFNITREDSIANWFSATQSFVVAIILLFLCLYSRGQSKFIVRGWGMLSCFFAFMAFDDATMFHERLGTTLKGVTAKFIENPSYDWQPIIAPFFGIAGFAMLYFLFNQFRGFEQRRNVLIAFTCLAIAVVLDFIDGMKIQAFSVYDISHFMKLFEELLEMIGNTIFLVTFLRLLLERLPSVKFIKNKQ